MLLNILSPDCKISIYFSTFNETIKKQSFTFIENFVHVYNVLLEYKPIFKMCDLIRVKYIRNYKYSLDILVTYTIFFNCSYFSLPSNTLQYMTLALPLMYHNCVVLIKYLVYNQFDLYCMLYDLCKYKYFLTTNNFFLILTKLELLGPRGMG